ncbi:putative glycoside hydrolase [Paramaledivibacter caminithermalis]|uniref:Putative glycosyl hydrolase domain-containing protein n=1 Tax=Paramaledivibacter caminithermalis (strain DSM 15212 / CIP 107654 / DViRD3) TaxID=1121301 RepID=A0A1M6LPT8_PARC5|nr:Putative glycosyl hydrolase domain-containing protein [Paramaledivibacter caminithermalis DSM 15212]
MYGLSVPDAHPYETIYRCTKDSVMRNKNIETPAIIRPWIQDFTATWVEGHIRYGAEEVKAQIKALEDNGVKEYLLWNPGNRYSEGGLK